VADTTYEVEMRWRDDARTLGHGPGELIATRTFGTDRLGAFQAGRAWVERGELDGQITAAALPNRTAQLYQRQPLDLISAGYGEVPA
jgi:hypothetical protein